MTIEGPRAATRDELPLVVELADRVFRARADTSMGRDFPLLFQEDNLQGLRIFTDDARPVALVGMFRRDIRLLGTQHTSCAIGAVSTDPEYRGQGLATRLLEDARQISLRDGVDILLISGGRGLYRRLGYVTVGGYYYAAVERDRLPAAGGFALRPWAPEDLPALMRLHSSEPVRFARSPADFLTLLEAERIHDGLADTRAVVAAGEETLLAYVTYKRPGARRVPEDAVEVDEMAGSRAAIAYAVGGLLDEYGVSRVILNCLDCDVEMQALARRHGWPTAAHGFRGTVGIINPERFWRACEPLFRERLGDGRFTRLGFRPAGRITLTYGEEELALGGMSELTNLVFLPESRRDELDLALPADSELAEVLDELLPLPLVEYGLNYV